ncbi:Nn.00g075210.m01.CDS01 [Neocucurbitaria sp. VM-36]
MRDPRCRSLSLAFLRACSKDLEGIASSITQCQVFKILDGEGTATDHQQFPDRHDRPKIKAWRCDLTALSHIANLYFVACNDTIHVYQPSFPDQSLASVPELVLCPPISPKVGPGVDPQDPHSITRIHVSYLGHDEILLATCDDGDVVGYRIEEIQKGLDRLTKSDVGNLQVYGEDDIKVFLHRNVGASAWGLAVHREARMIAISANTHNITVLAYALSHPVSSESDESDSSELKTSECEPSADFPSPRRQDHIFTLTAENNIPAVSFNNNGDDPSGRWLFSSSIDGKTSIWDLHHHRPLARCIQLGWCASTKSSTAAPWLEPGQCMCLDHTSYPHGAWGATMLDTRAAYELSPGEEESILEPSQIAPCFKDVSEHKKQFTISVKKHNSHLAGINASESSNDSDEVASDMVVEEAELEEEDSTSDSEEGQNEVLSSDADSDAMSIDNGDEQDTADAEATEDQDGPSMQSPEASLQNDETHDDSLFVPETQAMPAQSSIGTQAQLDPPPTTPPHLTTALPWFFQPLSAEMTDVMWNDSDGSDEEEEYLLMPTSAQAQMAYANRTRMPTRRPYCEISALYCSPPPTNTPTGPCLILTKEEIYLVQRPFQLSSSDLGSVGPVVSMRRPLHPGPWTLFLGSHDRMCYFAQIPELGVFVVASPLGRAAVFSIYWTKAKGHAVPQYGFKLEYLLPFEGEHETEVCDVQGARLAGLTVGPVQGMFDVPRDVEGTGGGEFLLQPRRWRLLMYYTDHTVLSFEISKQRASESPALSELVV